MRGGRRELAVGGVAAALAVIGAVRLSAPRARDAERHPPGPPRAYDATLAPIASPTPLLADHPDLVHPVEERRRFEGAPLVVDEPADLDVRAWRFSYHARGIVELPNRLAGRKTALVVVHPWGIDDGQGWSTPEPAGGAFGGWAEKNALMHRHAAAVVAPLVERLRGRVGLVLYSLPGFEDGARRKLYRSIRARPTAEERAAGARELAATLGAFDYRSRELPATLALAARCPATDYLRQLPGLDGGDGWNGAGFFGLPVPVMRALPVHEDDVVHYDGDGYEPLRAFLAAQGIEHVLLAGYHADLCVRSTPAGWRSLRADFDVFLVGDAVQATFPASPDARYTTNAAVVQDSLEVLVTQSSWIR